MGVVQGLMGAKTARDSGKRQEDAANAANTINKEQYEQNRKDTAPWREAGLSALPNLQNQNNFKDFTMADFQKDPGYQFGMDEGQKALERSASARGGLNSGGFMKALSRYGQDYAGTKFTEARNAFNVDRDSRYNRLASLAGIGQVANTQIGNAGQNFSNMFGQNITQGANARAAGSVAAMNSFQQGVSQDREVIRQGMGAMFCDARIKENIVGISDADIQEFRQNVQPMLFNYISSDFGDGVFAGPLAQDLEKSRLGRTLVKTDKSGLKTIDTLRTVMLLLALQGKAA
jgi:hypothetical protein